MSDNSSSTGSNSSSNSWTMLNPEEAAIESLGPGDDGTESLGGDIPSLSEEITGIMMEARPVETLLSEEGQQVCQETAPEASEGPVPFDWDSQPPVIHDIMTSSPADNNDQLSAMPFVTHAEPQHIADLPEAEPEEERSPPPEVTSAGSVAPESPAVDDTPVDAASLTSVESLVPSLPSEPTPAVESLVPSLAEVGNIVAETISPADVFTDGDLIPKVEESVRPSHDSPPPLETLGATERVEEEPAAVEAEPAAVEAEPAALEAEPVAMEAESVAPVEEEAAVEKEESELPEKIPDVVKEEEPLAPADSGRGDASSAEDDGLRRRNVPSFEERMSSFERVPSFEMQRPTSSEDSEEEEFRLAERKVEEKQGFSLNHLIVAALVLLCLGSLFLTDDSDLSELSDTEEMDTTVMLDKLAQENKQIDELEAQLQSHKAELEGTGALGKENDKLKEEVSSLPVLTAELEALRARVAELTQLTANPHGPAPPPSSSSPPAGEAENTTQSSKATAGGPERRDAREGGGRMKEELRRQKDLLEESRKRLEGMKRGGGRSGEKKGVREKLAEMQRRLTEQVGRMEKKKSWDKGSKWDAKKENHAKNGHDHWKKDEKRGEKEWKHGKDKHDDGKHYNKHNSHKEAWRKYQDEWDRKKDERRSDREKRKSERTWHKSSGKNFHPHHHHPNHHHDHHHHQHQAHHSQHQQPQQHIHHGQHSHHQPQQHHEHYHRQQHQHQHQPQKFDHATFWAHQAAKLGRLVHPRTDCHGIEKCALSEGLYPVELSEFESLLDGYLGKLVGAELVESKEEFRRLIGTFFEGGVFVHDRALFAEFAEDVADILEDMADVLEDEEDEGHSEDEEDALEEEMEEFEREALWKFGITA